MEYTNQILVLKISLKNSTDQVQRKVLYFNHILTNNITLIDGDIIINAGSSVKMRDRGIKSVFTAFDISLKPHQTKTIYLKRTGHHILNTKVFIDDQMSFYKYESGYLDIYKFYAGAILALFFYNFFIAVLIKKKIYSIYCFYLISVFLSVATTQGIIDYIDILPTNSFSHYLIIYSSLAVIFSISFTRYFLETDLLYAKFKYIHYAFIALASVPILWAFMPWYNSTVWALGYYIEPIIAVSLLVMVVIGLYIGFVKKSVMGKVYVGSWIFLFVGAFFYLASTHGIIDSNFIYKNGVLFGNIIEMLTLSLGLGYQIVILGKEKDEAMEKIKVKEKLQRLLRVLSHDIGNSLQIADLYITRGKKKSESDTLDKILDNTKQALGNIKNILNNVRQEQELEDVRESIECSEIDLRKVLDQVVFLFSSSIKKKDITLEINLYPDSSVLAEETTLVNNVIGNIISNCIKFSPEKGIIKINSYITEGKLVLSVCDNGSGFSEEVMNNFNCDKRITSTQGTLGEKGSGFGLRIVQNYMQLYNNAEVKLKNDNGACYTLFFSKFDS